MINSNEMRSKLINSAIQVIANDGLDKATTKQICFMAGVNEVYIYRCFENKEDLYAKCFEVLDEELLDVLIQHVSVMNMENLEYKLRYKLFFSVIWSFMVGSRDRCITYIRYYYSEYFVKFSADAHKERYAEFTKTISAAFKDEADVWMILNHILDTLLSFAIKVHNNQMPQDENYAEHVFRVVYAAITQYFTESKEKDC